MEQLKRNDMNFHIRGNTLDKFIVGECFAYLNKITTTKDDIWLDAGGNIGAFACVISNKVKKVITIEPDEENFNILLNNLITNNCGNVEAINKAIVEGDQEEVVEYE